MQGPLFFKYNNVLRGVSVEGSTAVPFLANLFQKLCAGNVYKNTLHAISAAIGKLSKLTKCDTVYRAPGGVLPRAFWEPDGHGIKGGVEMGFMSTSRSKEAAMHYAKMSVRADRRLPTRAPLPRQACGPRGARTTLALACWPTGRTHDSFPGRALSCSSRCTWAW